MKLVLAIINDEDAQKLISYLNKNGFQVTKLASTGGFLRDGNTTLMIGTEGDRVGQVMDILRETCAKRTQTETVAPHATTGGVPTWSMGYTPVKVTVGGATVFVLDVEDFQKL